MQRIQHNGTAFYHFTTFDHPALTHGIFTRLGGVSAAQFQSLNVGSTVGDDLDNVRTNRKRMCAALDTHDDLTRTTWQVHGADVVAVRAGEPRPDELPKADGIITADAGVPLVMRFADCVPILLFDPVRRAVGIAHAGWRGTAVGIGPATVRAMEDAYGSRPADIIAGIGPSIGPCHYEVGPEVVAQIGDAFRDGHEFFHTPADGAGKAHFDLWAANVRALKEAGVGQIDVAGICTACRLDEFYSHRAEAGRTGRFGALIMIR